jgi:hypothetical protein
MTNDFLLTFVLTCRIVIIIGFCKCPKIFLWLFEVRDPWGIQLDLSLLRLRYWRRPPEDCLV